MSSDFSPLIPRAVGLGGSGADGAKTVAASEDITPDTWYEYTTLTVDPGQTLGLSAAGRMLLRCSGKVTVNGTISLEGCGAAGGVGGALVTSAVGNDGTDPAATESNGGLVGGSGGGGGGGGDTGLAGGAGKAGKASTDTGCGTAGSAGAAGAPGTNGGNAGSGTDYEILYGIEYFMDSVGKLLLNTAPGGGGAGSGASNDATPSGAGGAGGDGGGNLLLIAPEVEVGASGKISADGGDGGDGVNPSANAGSGGAGGGGAGGTLIIITKKYTNNGTVSANGGAAGQKALGWVYGGSGGSAGAGNLKVILV